MSHIIEGEDQFSKFDCNLFFYPPEYCHGKDSHYAGKPVDIWALGVTGYILTYLVYPFMPKNMHNMMELLDKISNQE